MRNTTLLFSCLLTILSALNARAQTENVYMDPNKPVEERVEDLLSKMTMDEKADYLTGINNFSIKGIERLGIPEVITSNGPQGARLGSAEANSVHLPSDQSRSTAMPTAIAMGASWNPDTVRRAGANIARDCRNLGSRVLLGPTVCIVRNPYGGRNFETFSEDPFLSGEMVVPYIQGVQEEGVAATVKHYATNNQEFKRFRIRQTVSERALREIYLPGFKQAVERGGSWSVMTAYPMLNGQRCSENEFLLRQVLKDEWGFRGFVMTDWWATRHCTAKTMVDAGLDLEMPRGLQWKDKGKGKDAVLVQLVKNGDIQESDLDDKVRRIARALFSIGAYDTSEKPVYDKARQRLECLNAARESITLLKNDGKLLPLKPGKIKRLAVIGPFADMMPHGGGSSIVCTDTYITPLAGIKQLAGKDMQVRYAPGAHIHHDKVNSINPSWLRLPDSDKQGARASYYTSPDMKGSPAVVRDENQFGVVADALAKPPQLNGKAGIIRYETRLVPPRSGRYRLTSYCASGKVELTFGDQATVEVEHNVKKWRMQNAGDDIRPPKLSQKEIEVTLTAGQEIPLTLDYFYRGDGMANSAVKLTRVERDHILLAEAEKEAKEADAVVLCVGLFNGLETEGHDMQDLYLPKEQLALIEKVSAANPNTVVVLNTGTALMIDDWQKKVPALVLPYYPGQEGGQAVAEVLFGKTNPSGKLPFSFFKRWEDCPASANYQAKDKKKLDVTYTEDIFVGYRHLDQNGIAPLFAFGHGLSYTEFEYGDLAVSKKGPNSVEVSFTVTNSGTRDGAEVAQVYVGDLECSVPRPPQELKGFRKLFLKAGESERVTLQLDKDAFSFWHPETKKWTLEPGKFKILIGASSRNIRQTAEIEL